MSIGQLFFKQAAIFTNNNTHLSFISKYALNPSFYAAVSFFAIATITWVQILKTMKISVAYPLLSVSYVITAAGAYYFFGERISSINIIGILLIMFGVSLVSVK
jgi:multidrug transporter EmrE-like cation transporter